MVRRPGTVFNKQYCTAYRFTYRNKIVKVT
jgi:hypothetical protein